MSEIPMAKSTGFLAAIVVIGSLSIPAWGQSPSPYSQQQPGPSRMEDGSVPQPIYGQPAYGYSENILRATIGQLLGSRYNETDRTAVEWCASASIMQAAVQYPAQSIDEGHRNSGQSHPFGEGYNPAATMRIASITDVHRRDNGLHVSGMIDSRLRHPRYGYVYGYQNNGYTVPGYLSFSCDVDYNGIVYNLRVHRAETSLR